MVRTTTRAIYLVVLVVVLGRSLSPLPGTGLFIWSEERWDVVVLTAVTVREFYVTSHLLWLSSQRWYRRLQRRRQAKARLSDPDLQVLAAQMFPDPPEPDARAWAEELALAAVKRSLRGLFSLLPEASCAALYRRLRWPLGRCCIYCGDTNLRTKDPHYRLYWQRHECLDCSAKRGHEVTFTDLSGTILEGSHLPCRLWMWGAFLFVFGCSTQELAQELQVNYKTARRMVFLFQLSYLTQRFRCPLTGPVEIDEIYIIGGLKGKAGGQPLNRPPRRRRLKKRGRGTWFSDKTPVLGLVDRKGQVYLIPCANVQSKTIQPFVERLVARGAKVYTDEYKIYAFLEQLGYRHESVNHSQGEYARGEVHSNTIEGIWSLLRSHLAIHRGVSKVYLPLYVARFEFLHNRRHQNRWGQMVDLLVLGWQADGRRLRRLIREGRVREACPIPGLEMS